MALGTISLSRAGLREDRAWTAGGPAQGQGARERWRPSSHCRGEAKPWGTSEGPFPAPGLVTPAGARQRGGPQGKWTVCRQAGPAPLLLAPEIRAPDTGERQLRRGQTPRSGSPAPSPPKSLAGQDRTQDASPSTAVPLGSAGLRRRNNKFGEAGRVTRLVGWFWQIPSTYFRNVQPSNRNE